LGATTNAPSALDLSILPPLKLKSGYALGYLLCVFVMCYLFRKIKFRRLLLLLDSNNRGV